MSVDLEIPSPRKSLQSLTQESLGMSLQQTKQQDPQTKHAGAVVAARGGQDTAQMVSAQAASQPH